MGGCSRDARATAERATLRIAFVTSYDPGDPRNWSGIPAFMLDALSAQGIEIEPVDVGGLTLTERIVERVVQRAASGIYSIEVEPLVARRRGRRVYARSVDVVFTPAQMPVATAHVIPTVFWADATFAAMLDFYPGYAQLSPRTKCNALALDRRAIARASAAIYASEWAARSAIEDCGADPRRVFVVPFGANLAQLPTRAEAEHLLQQRSLDTCRLLFVGVEWERKGGAIAVEAARILNERGLPTELVVVGSSPPPGERPPFVRVEGRIDKAREPERLARLYAQAHLLVLPSRAECYGCVLAEAAAFGVPSIATRVGGIPSAVEDGVTGLLLDLAAPASDYADAIERARARYVALGAAAIERYHERLNWTAAAATVKDIVDGVLQQGRS